MKQVRAREPLAEYFEALNRLKIDEPIRVPPGTPINNNSVSLEAGRKVGSIKKSRDVFADLILSIQSAATEQTRLASKDTLDSSRALASAKDFRKLWEDGLQRELCLFREIMQLKQALAKLTGSNVIPLRPPSGER